MHIEQPVFIKVSIFFIAVEIFIKKTKILWIRLKRYGVRVNPDIWLYIALEFKRSLKSSNDVIDL